MNCKDCNDTGQIMGQQILTLVMIGLSVMTIWGSLAWTKYMKWQLRNLDINILIAQDVKILKLYL